VAVAGSGAAPFYVIPFDADGVCTGPLTRKHLIEALGNGTYTDVFVFSHGWNNTWPSAMRRYDSFIAGMARTRAEHPLAGQEFRPLLIGVFWPSAVLVQPEERAPDFAGESAPAPADDEAVAEERRQIDEVGAALPAERRGRFYELAQRRELGAGEAEELAGILAPLWAEDAATDDLGASATLPPEDLLDIWVRLSEASSGTKDELGFATGGFGFTDDAADAPPVTGDPAAAGLFDQLRKLDPRDAVRGTTVWLMKDRSGRVGARGVSPLLADVLNATGARVHLVGHSYGCKVVLSALCASTPPRPVESVLLLQPAMSHLCFAARVPGLDTPGGYRAALDPARCRQPILATFSSRDEPLTRTFHFFVRRRSDLGETVIAGEAPSRYAALGGFGPPRVPSETDVIEARAPGMPYPSAGAARVFGVDASPVIADHSDVSNASTWWMLLDRVNQGS
jgi:hypothetical protein